MLSIPPDQRPSLRRQQALPAVTSCSAACCNPSYTQRALTGPSTLYARKGSALQLPGALQLQPCACPTQQCRTCMAKTSNHSHLRSTRMQAWVGGEEPPATQYFATDFDWHDLRNDPATVAALERQEAQALEARQAAAPAPQDGGASVWESFHARVNGTARFYKERRYLLLEFPALAVQQPPQHFLELGCGCGSSLLPILKANPTCRVAASDVSATAVSLFEQAAAQAGISGDRIRACVADDSHSGAALPAGAGAVDAVLIVFTLAALHPDAMHGMLRRAWESLRTGGQLLIRDHAVADLTQLRLHGNRLLAPHLYRREDGTTCYFFSVEDLAQRVQAAGFILKECDYACTLLKNKKRGLNMKRVFIHCIAQKGEVRASLSPAGLL